MESILGSWSRVFRFLIILIIVLLFATKVVSRFFTNSEVSLEFSDNRTIVKVKNDGQTISQSILAASDCWIKTGIVVKPNESYTIKVTGKIHTAADYLLRDVANDTIPSFQWSGPEGREFRIRSQGVFEKYDQMRKNLLIDPNANMGCVLFYFQDEDAKEPSCSGGSDFFPRPNNIKVYNNNKGLLEGKNSGTVNQNLWASINDMLIMDTTDNIRLAYLGAELKGDTLKRKINKWESIKKSTYRKLWFDDNIGSYIISVQVKE